MIPVGPPGTTEMAVQIKFRFNGSVRDDRYWTCRKNKSKLIELSTVNKISLV